MADISQVQVDSTTYDVHDATARTDVNNEIARAKKAESDEYTRATTAEAALRNSISQASAVTKWVYLYGSESTPKEYVKYHQNGKIVELVWKFTQETKQTWAAGNIPKPFRPSSSVAGACYRSGPNGPTNNVALYDVWGNGDVRFTTLDAEAKGFLVGYCCWPIS